MIRAVLALVAVVAMALSSPVAAQDPARVPCAGNDKACAKQALRIHPVRGIAMWQSDIARPLDARIAPAPAALVEYLTLDNISHGYPQRPRAAVLEPGFVADLHAAIAELPPRVWRLFADKLAGIYLVEDLGGTGFTDMLRDTALKPVAGYVVLDAAVLRGQTANAWATWKESSPFKPREGYGLRARIEADSADNRKNAIQYILLHELGHVLSIGTDSHPSWSLVPLEVPVWARFPFFELSWQIDRSANRYHSVFDAAFPQRTRVAYYFGAKLDAADVAATYANLERTNFASLYAATQPGDDFAEAFASYVHVVLQQRPWEIAISQPGAPSRTFKACWDEPRCAAKRKLLEELLGH